MSQPATAPAAAPLPWRSAAALILLAAALQLFALWSRVYVPLVDLPNHVARHYLESVRLRGGDLPPFYSIDYRVLPNLGGDLVLPVLMLVFSPTTACKLFLTLSVLLYWLGPAAFLWQCLGSRTQALAASLLLLPWTFTGHLFWGFLNYYSGVGLAFLVLAHHLWLARRERLPVGGLLVHAALVALLFLWHLAPWVLYCVIAGCRVAAGLVRTPGRLRPRLFRAAAVLAPILPSLILYGWYRLGDRAATADAGWDWGGWPHKLLGPLRFFGAYDWRIDLAVGLLWVAAVAATIGVPRFKEGNWAWILPALAALAGLYLVLPVRLGSTSDADTRVLPALLVLGVAAAGSAPVRRVRLAAVLLAACLLLRFGSILYAWDGLSTRLDSQARAFTVLAPRSRVLPVILVPELAKTYPEMHFAAWAVPSREVFLPTLFAYRDQQPLRLNPPSNSAVAAPEVPYTGDEYTIEEKPVREGYDYVWVYNPGKKTVHAPVSFETVFREGDLTVLRVPPAASAPASPAAPAIRLAGESGAAVEVTGLPEEVLSELARGERKPDEWAAAFAVYVDPGDGADPTQRPAVLGAYAVRDGALRFTPRYPLAPGVRYRAVFRPDRLPGGQKGLEALVKLLFIPRPPAEPAAVEQVYPTADKLPENELKFYLHFTSPMSRGEAYRRIRLLDADGKPVDGAFLELGEELWDPSGKRFTLLIDPGRIKRGLKPREDLGPVLERGKTYTLVIDRDWKDADGEPLKEGYKKTFQAVAADEAAPDPKTWRLQPPAAGGKDPLAVVFPKAMDHALLLDMLWVTDAAGRKVAGDVSVTDGETRWRFTPREPWAAGAYRLTADTRLEDLAGNSIGRPFEVDETHPTTAEIKAETAETPFEVRAAGAPK